jgi:hypothetical protein
MEGSKVARERYRRFGTERGPAADIHGNNVCEDMTETWERRRYAWRSGKF